MGFRDESGKVGGLDVFSILLVVFLLFGISLIIAT
jgi:hypothetical protein